MGKGFPSKLTPAEREAAVREYLTGAESLSAVAGRYGISVTSLHHMVQRRTNDTPARTRAGLSRAANDAHMRQAIAQERIAAALEAKNGPRDGLVDHWRSQSEYHDQFVDECSHLLGDWAYDDDVAIEAIVQAGIKRVVKALESALPFLFATDGKSFACLGCNQRAWQAAGFTYEDHAVDCRLSDVTMPARQAAARAASEGAE